MFGGPQGGYGGMQGGYGGGGMQGGYGGGMQGGYGGGFGGGVNIMPGTPYKILSAYDRTFCIDSSQGTFDRGELILYKFHGGSNQIFTFQPSQSVPGSYYILNHKDGAVEPAQDNFAKGRQVWCERKLNQGTQAWKVVPGVGPAQGRGVHLVMADGPGYCLDINHEQYENGSEIITWMCEGKANQTWILEPHY